MRVAAVAVVVLQAVQVEQVVVGQAAQTLPVARGLPTQVVVAAVRVATTLLTPVALAALAL
jgi:hypothetical protein